MNDIKEGFEEKRKNYKKMLEKCDTWCEREIGKHEYGEQDVGEEAI